MFYVPAAAAAGSHDTVVVLAVDLVLAIVVARPGAAVGLVVDAVLADRLVVVRQVLAAAVAIVEDAIENANIENRFVKMFEFYDGIV